jgi:hypothetical protein
MVGRPEKMEPAMPSRLADRPTNSTERSPVTVPLDVYISADVETDGPIPGPYSMLSLGFAVAGSYDGSHFHRADPTAETFYVEFRPISEQFQEEALAINQLDRDSLVDHGADPATAMNEAGAWVRAVAGTGSPVLVAYPLSFDWSWIYWYFVRFAESGSPFNHSRCFDLKTAYAVKSQLPISQAGRDAISPPIQASSRHTHNALDDAIEQAVLFANVFEWSGRH